MCVNMSAQQSITMLVNSVKQFLASQHMFALEEWVEGCVEYFIEQGTSNEKEIKSKAHEQWMLHDLKEISPGCLPSDLASTQKTVLNGQFVLQVNGAVDISVPAYQQYLKLKKTDIENIKATSNPEEKISSKRMLKLYLTDGIQSITGMEYETINKLKSDIVPGSKILIKGPVQCRQGMLLLTEGAVEILGGEVPEMVQTNSLAAILASKLQLPMIDDIDPMAVAQVRDTTTLTTQDDSRNNTRETNMATTQDNQRGNNEVSRPIRPTNQQTNPTEMNIYNEMEEYFDDVNDFDFREDLQVNVGKRQLDVENTAPEKRQKVESVAANVPTNSEYSEGDDLADLTFEDEEHLREIELQFEERFNNSFEETKRPVAVASEPYIYIKQINDLSITQKSGKVFRVKGQILKLLTKLSITDNRWSLKCTIVDGTGSLDVEFSSDILSELLGFTPQDRSELKKKIATNPEIKQKIDLALKKTKETLEVLYCIMELTMFDMPRITKLIDFDSTHVTLLQRRLNSSGL